MLNVKVNKAKTTFGDLDRGDIFTWGCDDDYYTCIKIDEVKIDGCSYNAINLEDGDFYHIVNRENIEFYSNTELILTK